MQLPNVISGAIIDIAKKNLFAFGKKIGHGFIDSVTGEKIGELICYRKKEGYNNVLLFVHGFSGSASETFGFIPQMLEENPQFRGWDIFSIGYSSDVFPSIGRGIWSVNPDITKISSYLRTLLENQFSDYDRFAIVAHSMGGLAAQRMILDLDKLNRNRLSHLLLFGTPSAGLKKASWVSFWNTQVRDLSSDSDFIKKLRSDWNHEFNASTNFSFKTFAGTKDEFVPTESSLAPFDEKYHGIIEGNHLNMIAPKDSKDIHNQCFEIIIRTLTNQQIAHLNGNPEDINLLIGDYQAIINKFSPNPNLIGLKELTKLVFALECTNKAAEAITVLNDHPSALKDSDTLGILGGRFKRKYLLEGLQADLDKAFLYYNKAYKIATKAKNNRQIFYNAINIAFLYIVAHNDNPKMLQYAQIALDNCNSIHKDMWEMATMAEANLYLGNISLAEGFYREASKIAGNDIRAKQSIYSNAYLGYQALMASNNKNAGFLLMLETVFLN
jgi:pimeloyl-ACP methyl ester carboxylesterase